MKKTVTDKLRYRPARVSTWSLLTLGLACAITSGCGSSQSISPASNSVNLSGSLNATSGGGSTSLSVVDGLMSYAGGVSLEALSLPIGHNFLVSLNSYKIECTTMDDPPVKVDSPVAADGSFSVDGIPPNAVGCQVIDASGNAIAPIVLSDPSSKDMKGDSATVSRVQLASDANLGSISFNSDDGTAVGTLSAALKESLADSSISNPEDFTGTYTVEDFDGTLPTGYRTACTSAEQQSGTCNGPAAGDSIYLKILHGKSFTPDSTCASAAQNGTLNSGSTCGGTTGTDDKYGILAWKDQASFAACGSKLGFSFVEAKGYANIDLTSSGINEGVLDWSTDDGNGHAITNGWQFANAVSSYAINDCNAVTVSGHDAWECHDSVNSTYQIGLNTGGCTDSSGNPIANIDWSKVNWASPWQSGTTSAYSIAGYTKYVNYPTYGASNEHLTCVNVSGTFTDAAGTTSGGTFDFNNVNTLLAQNGSCSSAPAGSLAQLQCYANALWSQSAIRNATQSSSVCTRKIRANWGATSASDFLVDKGPLKANNQYVAELFNYTSQDSGSFRMREDDYRGVQNGNSYITCHLENAMTISLKKREDGDLNMEFIVEVHDLDASNPTCKGAESQLGVGTTRMMMKMVKQ